MRLPKGPWCLLSTITPRLLLPLPLLSEGWWAANSPLPPQSFQDCQSPNDIKRTSPVYLQYIGVVGKQSAAQSGEQYLNDCVTLLLDVERRHSFGTRRGYEYAKQLLWCVIYTDADVNVYIAAYVSKQGSAGEHLAKMILFSLLESSWSTECCSAENRHMVLCWIKDDRTIQPPKTSWMCAWTVVMSVSST